MAGKFGVCMVDPPIRYKGEEGGEHVHSDNIMQNCGDPALASHRVELALVALLVCDKGRNLELIRCGACSSGLPAPIITANAMHCSWITRFA